MKVSLSWLQTFFETPPPDAEDIKQVLTFGAFEVEDVEGIGNDVVFDVNVLPNRAHDCLSHRGIAKELSVLLDIPMKRDPLLDQKNSCVCIGDLSVVVDDSNACPVYHAARISGITVGPSPDWLVKRLETIGQRSINNVVDATNFVMHELGQPLHAFDTGKLSLRDGIVSLRVRMARAGERIHILGGEEIELSERIQLITDASSEEPLAIAGIKGGAHAEVDNATTDIVLESAKFHPSLTRKASQILKIRTDASQRFENEIPDELPAQAMQTLIELILEVAGGKQIAYSYVQRQMPKLPYIVGFSSSEVNALLGTQLSDEEVARILQRFGFEFEIVRDPRAKIVDCARSAIGAQYKRLARIRFDTPESFNCSSLTSWCAIEAGYSFGIARIAIDQFAYLDHVDEKDALPGDFVFTNTGVVQKQDGVMYSRVLDTIVQDESIRTQTLEFLPGTDIGHGVDHVGVYVGDGKVIHASSSAGEVVEELLYESKGFSKEKWYRRVVHSNESRFAVTIPYTRLDLRLPSDIFEEIGRVYGYKNIPAKQLPPRELVPESNEVFLCSEIIRKTLGNLGFLEVYSYSFRDVGKVLLSNPLSQDKAYLRETLAGGIADDLEKGEYHASFLGLQSVLLYEIGTVFHSNEERVHVCVGVRSLDSKNRDSRSKEKLLEAKEALERVLGINLDVQIGDETFEFDIERAISGKKLWSTDLAGVAPGVVYVAPSSYPHVLRDIAVWVADGKGDSHTVLEMVQKSAGDLLVRADLFDTFTKDGRTSYAYHLVFQSREKTLTDHEINDIMEKVTVLLDAQEGWQVR